jgi:hypothetical protein
MERERRILVSSNHPSPLSSPRPPSKQRGSLYSIDTMVRNFVALLLVLTCTEVCCNILWNEVCYRLLWLLYARTLISLVLEQMGNFCYNYTLIMDVI